MMRDFISGIVLILLLSILLCNGSGKAEGVDPVSDRTISLELLPVNGKLVAGLREVAAQTNWQLEYLAASKTVIINYSGGQARLSLSAGRLNGQVLANPPTIIAGRTYLDLETVKLLITRIAGQDQPQLLTGIYTNRKEVPAGDKITAGIMLINLFDSPLSLTFNSGQRYDLFLKKAAQEVWRWSEGRFFTMALVTKELNPGAHLNYQLMVPTDGLKAGKYSLGGELTTIGNPLPLVDLEIKLLKE